MRAGREHETVVAKERKAVVTGEKESAVTGEKESAMTGERETAVTGERETALTKDEPAGGAPEFPGRTKERGIDGDEALKLENQLCFPLYAAARRVVSAYTPLLKPLGLTYTQYIVLMALWENDDITVGELGRQLRLDNGTLTPLLKKMEMNGLVKRRRNTEDERRVHILLTDKGRSTKDRVSGVPAEMRRCMPADFTPDDAHTLYVLLYKLLGA